MVEDKNYWQGFYDAAYILCLEGFVNEAKALVLNCYVPRILLKKVLENAVFNKLDEYIFSCKEYVETETEKNENWFANNKYWKDITRGEMDEIKTKNARNKRYLGSI